MCQRLETFQALLRVLSKDEPMAEKDLVIRGWYSIRMAIEILDQYSNTLYPWRPFIRPDNRLFMSTPYTVDPNNWSTCVSQESYIWATSKLWSEVVNMQEMVNNISESPLLALPRPDFPAGKIIGAATRKMHRWAKLWQWPSRPLPASW